MLKNYEKICFTQSSFVLKLKNERITSKLFQSNIFHQGMTKEVDEFFGKNEENVVVIHCRGGSNFKSLRPLCNVTFAFF